MPGHSTHPPDLKPIPLRRLLLFLFLFLAGIVCFVVGCLVEQRDRVAMPGLCLSVAALTSAALYSAIHFGKAPIAIWSPELRDKTEAPLCYCVWVVFLSAASLGFLGFAACAFLGLVPDHPSPPKSSARVDLLGFLVLVSMLGVSGYCFVRALRHLKPDSDWRVGKLLLPRHVSKAGRPWLVAIYLVPVIFLVGAFVAFLVLDWCGVIDLHAVR